MVKKKDNVPCIGKYVSDEKLSELADTVILYSFCSCGGEGELAIGMRNWKECKERMTEILKR